MSVPWPFPSDTEPDQWATSWFSGEAQALRRSHLTTRVRVSTCAKCGKRKPCRYDLLRGAAYCSEACWVAYTEPEMVQPPHGGSVIAGVAVERSTVAPVGRAPLPSSHKHEYRYDRKTGGLLCPCGERMEARV